LLDAEESRDLAVRPPDCAVGLSDGRMLLLHIEASGGELPL